MPSDHTTVQPSQKKNWDPKRPILVSVFEIKNFYYLPLIKYRMKGDPMGDHLEIDPATGDKNILGSKKADHK